MNKKKEIKIDKEFLDVILENFKNLKDEFVKQNEEFNFLKDQLTKKENLISTPLQEKEDKVAFWCVEIALKKNNFQVNLPEFRKQLEDLMKKYKVVSILASLFAQL